MGVGDSKCVHWLWLGNTDVDRAEKEGYRCRRVFTRPFSGSKLQDKGSNLAFVFSIGLGKHDIFKFEGLLELWFAARRINVIHVV
jgi:hypothetical protein